MRESDVTTLLGFMFGEVEGRERRMWAAKLTPLDAIRSTNAISVLHNNGRPVTVEAFDAQYRRLATDGGATSMVAALPGAPEWVHKWKKLRDAGDFHALPEQQPGFERLGFPWPPPEGVL